MPQRPPALICGSAGSALPAGRGGLPHGGLCAAPSLHRCAVVARNRGVPSAGVVLSAGVGEESDHGGDQHGAEESGGGGVVNHAITISISSSAPNTCSAPQASHS